MIFQQIRMNQQMIDTNELHEISIDTNEKSINFNKPEPQRRCDPTHSLFHNISQQQDLQECLYIPLFRLILLALICRCNNQYVCTVSLIGKLYNSFFARRITSLIQETGGQRVSISHLPLGGGVILDRSPISHLETDQFLQNLPSPSGR